MLDILPYRADYYPVLGQIMREMDVAGTINRIVDARDSQAKIDVGTFVCLMIHNLLGDVNIRLYNMDSFFEDKALPLLVPWKSYIDISEINDDRAARVLDTMWVADPQKVFSAVANESIRIHELDTSIIHGDTTSKSFEERKKTIEQYLLKKKCIDRATIKPIKDKYGPSIKDEFDAIVISPETKPAAEEINDKRRRNMKKPLKIVQIPFVLANDGTPISSSRIRKKEIDENGRILKID